MDQGGLDQDMIYEFIPELKGTIVEAMNKSEASKLIEAIIEYMRYIGNQERMDANRWKII